MPIELPSGRFFGSLRKSIEIETARLSETHYVSGERQPAHTHQVPHMCLIVQGNYEERVGRERRIIPHGALTFYHPEQIHTETHFSDGIHFLIEMRSTQTELLRTLPSHFGAEPFCSGPGVSIARRLYQEFRQPDAFSAVTMEALTLELFVASLRGEFSSVAGRRPLWLKRVLDIVHSRFTNPPSLSMIAQEADVHPVHLARTFRKFEGVTIGDYIRRLRVAYVREKLLRTSDPLAEIALEAGFADQTHLTKVFKKITGFTPHRFRNRS